MRQMTVLLRAGSVFTLGGWEEGVDAVRGMVRVGLPDVLGAGIDETDPMIEAHTLDSYT